MRIACFFLVVLFLAVPAWAESPLDPRFGISMVGQPKYTQDSPHLDYVNPNAPKGGTLKQAAIGSFDTLNPHNIKGKAADGLNLITDRLYARVWDEPFSLYPLVAERSFMPLDRSYIRFDLNPKARFHDGKAITTGDVLFSYQTLKQYGRPNMRRLYQLAEVDVMDARSIQFTFKEGYDRETALIFAMMPILPRHYWDERDFDATTLDIPLGSGPYRITEADVGKRVVYERVKDYWAADLLPNRGHHNFDRIVYDYYRDDTVALEIFKKGDIDVRREWDAGQWHSAYDFDAVTSGAIKAENIKHGRADKVRGLIMNSRRTPFDDPDIREALSLLIDFDWLNKNLFYGAYQPTLSFFPNTDLGRDGQEEETRSTRQKMRAADQLLRQAGWIVQDGKRVNAETGDAFTFEILMDDPQNEKIALTYIRALKRLGIEARARLLDSAAYRGRLNDYDFDMIVHFWHSTLSPGTEQYLYWSCEAAEQPAQWNFSGICNPVIDELTQQIPTAQTREELLAMTQRLDQMLWEAHLFVPLYYNDHDYVARWSYIQRPEKTPLYGVVMETWWREDGAEPPK